MHKKEKTTTGIHKIKIFDYECASA